jgi:prephenate dehydrogenase
MYRSIVIVGVGLIGGSLGLAIRRKHPEIRVAGVSSPAAIESALEMGIVTDGFGYDELGRAVRGADLVALCTPIHRILELLTLLGPLLDPGAAVTDVGSTKRVITRHARSALPAGVPFIGGHPMAGSENRGVLAADPFLFQNAIYVLCPGDDAPAPQVETLSALLGDIGAHVTIMDAEIHDRIAAAVSHLPQMLAIALVETAGGLDSERAPYLRLAAGGFRDMTRIASSPFSVWNDIFRTNGDAVRDAADAFIERLKVLRGRIGAEALGEDFEIANHTRATIPKDTKGFLRTLSDVLVVVEDKPGIIAKIASTLAEEGINIQDIEVLKVREGEGGTLRLSFNREEDARKAAGLMERIGFTARVRK